ncbi:MAG: hypothetical protein Q7W45_04340 [Bacteroidota bacterium]|nr:hypothetical protein [Bacteroidota bacterium]MDP3144677.1 hypothetical protein [Bacteroidota bacterium]MDP3557013.1 hypothetical protein [Bacteroidota bacterium]
MNSTKKIIIWVVLFSIAMGFMESAVVIYLREIYYKTGFNFPLKQISPFIAKIEFFREIATIIMLVGCGIIAGKNKLQRFAYFVLGFAIWDIFYYIFLYVCLGWPQSLSTWDILFLIPVPWVGPVWAPCLLSLLMIIGSVFIIYQVDKKPNYKIDYRLWWLLISGAIICIVSFMWDYLIFANKKVSIWSIASKENLFSEIDNYIPTQFNSPLFFLGFSFMLSSVVYSIYKSNKK